MKRTRDPLTGTPRYPCANGHRHTNKARAEACEAKPSAKKSKRALFGHVERETGRAKAEFLVRAVLSAVPDEGIRGFVWRQSLESWLAGSVVAVDESTHAYQLGALAALELDACLPHGDPRVILAELRALAVETALANDGRSTENRIRVLLDALKHAKAIHAGPASGRGAGSSPVSSIPPGAGSAGPLNEQVGAVVRGAWRDVIGEAHVKAAEIEKGERRSDRARGAWAVVNHLRERAP